MDFKLIVFISSHLLLCHAAHIPEVYENIQKSSMDKFDKPPTFNYKEYQKSMQVDPQRVRYQQQQQSDQNTNGQNNREPRKYVINNFDAKTSAHDTIANQHQHMPIQGSKMEFGRNFQESKKVGTPLSGRIALEDLQKESPQLPKSKITKKSLRPNSYAVNEDEESGVKRQDDSNYLNYVNRNPKVQQHHTLGGFVAPTAAGEHLQALNSLLGQSPENQLQGLQHLLQQPINTNPPVQYYKDHTPIKEELIDIPNTQRKPNVNTQPLSNTHVVNQALQSLSKSGNSPDALKSLQAQLDATASAHAESIIEQAQKKALQHVKEQHEAIARAQKAAEQAALEQIKIQNDALLRAQAHAEQEAEAKKRQEFKEKEEKRKAAQLRRQQEAIRERARIAALAYKHKLEEEKKEQQAKPHKDDPHTVAQNTRAKNAQKHKKVSVNEPAETQHHYFTAPSILTQYQPQQLTATAQTYYAPIQAQPTQYQHKPSYNEYEDNSEVSKYYVQPQFTVIGQTKNAHGESELHYAANYEFGYRIKDYNHGNDFGHKETKDGETTKGVYHALLPDGRIQTVSYYVDDSGYHAEVSYNGAGSQALH